MPTKYQTLYNLMKANHQQMFVSFQTIHDGYQAHPEKWEEQFHTKGRDLLDIIRSYERKLCSKMERTSHGQYSNSVAEKFWSLVKKDFPLVDHIGVTVSKPKH